MFKVIFRSLETWRGACQTTTRFTVRVDSNLLRVSNLLNLLQLYVIDTDASWAFFALPWGFKRGSSRFWPSKYSGGKSSQLSAPEAQGDTAAQVWKWLKVLKSCLSTYRERASFATESTSRCSQAGKSNCNQYIPWMYPMLRLLTFALLWTWQTVQ